MASPATAAITIRKLDETVKNRLRVQAAEHGRSMEEEAREILKTALNQTASEPENLATALRKRFAAVGGVDLPTPEREPIRSAPDFRK